MVEKQKSQAELEIESLQEVFGIATTSFKEFYKKTKNSAKGDHSTAASSGDRSTAASSGNYSKAASSGDHSAAASSGNYSTATSSGDYSTAASSGDYSTATSSGDRSKAASSGDCSACAAVGYRAAVRGEEGNLIMATEYTKEDGGCVPIGGKADIIDGKKLKPDCWYIVEGGEWVEVDFTDGVFSRVISRKNGIVKVKTDDEDVLYIVSDNEGNSAHGKTIKEASEELIYKVSVEFNGDVPQSATGEEWVGIYRSITGARSIGVKMFVEEMGVNLNNTYTRSQIIEMTSGRYGAEKFQEVASKNS